MKYSLNNVEFDIELNQELINDSTIDYKHNDIMPNTCAWYAKGYTPIQLSDTFFKNIRHKTYNYINTCMVDNNLGELVSIEKYHRQVPSDEAHLQMLKRVGKVIPPDVLGINVKELASRIKQACGIRYALDCKDVCDIRIFRPYSGKTMDNNPLHRDTWLPILNNCINVYIPVFGNNRLSSLSVIPGSHIWNRKDVERTNCNANIHGIQYGLPSVGNIHRKFKVVRPRLGANEALLFSSNLIHGGAVNLHKDITRISIEIRFWLRA